MWWISQPTTLAINTRITVPQKMLINLIILQSVKEIGNTQAGPTLSYQKTLSHNTQAIPIFAVALEKWHAIETPMLVRRN